MNFRIYIVFTKETEPMGYVYTFTCKHVFTYIACTHVYTCENCLITIVRMQKANVVRKF